MSSVHERTAAFLDPLARPGRDIITPEGVALRVVAAEFGERVAAFLLDVLFITVAVFVMILCLAFAFAGGENRQALVGVGTLVVFLVRTLYFTVFELAWRGSTPGKRVIGLRVIDRRGGPLRPASVMARNLMRELETFAPLMAVLGLGGASGGVGSRLAFAGVLVVLALLPLFNRDRMRIGDLIAGTMVIALPKRRLLDDLVGGVEAAEFTAAQLGVYGAFELQVLEELLRRPAGAETARLLGEASERIRRRIGWGAAERDAEGFLRRFYTAQRGFLERERLYGRVRESKEGG